MNSFVFLVICVAVWIESQPTGRDRTLYICYRGVSISDITAKDDCQLQIKLRR